MATAPRIDPSGPSLSSAERGVAKKESTVSGEWRSRSPSPESESVRVPPTDEELAERVMSTALSQKPVTRKTGTGGKKTRKHKKSHRKTKKHLRRK